MAVFLTAEWRDLVMLNWQVDPSLLASRLPRGTEIDEQQGRTWISVVGFRFLKTRLLGVPIPGHVNFEELNVRYYDRRRVDGDIRRGVVFNKEIVPRFSIAAVARGLYNENYVCGPMSHRIESAGDSRTVEYSWSVSGRSGRVSLTTDPAFREIEPGSREEFITEHYHGYSVQRDGGTVEYAVRHPRWRYAEARNVSLEWDPISLYGPEFGAILLAPPDFSFLAEGSAVTVDFGRRLPEST